MVEVKGMSERKLLTEAEVAASYGISQRTLLQHRFLDKGLPYCRVEGRVYYRAVDLEEYLEMSRHDPGSK